MIEYFRELGDEYSGSYKCALFRDPDPFLLRNLCSATGRGYPDISAQAAGCAIFLYAQHDISMGTTCAVSVCSPLLPSSTALRRAFSSTQLTANFPDSGGLSLAA